MDAACFDDINIINQKRIEGSFCSPALMNEQQNFRGYLCNVNQNIQMKVPRRDDRFMCNRTAVEEDVYYMEEIPSPEVRKEAVVEYWKRKGYQDYVHLTKGVKSRLYPVGDYQRKKKETYWESKNRTKSHVNIEGVFDFQKTRYELVQTPMDVSSNGLIAVISNDNNVIFGSVVDTKKMEPFILQTLNCKPYSIKFNSTGDRVAIGSSGNIQILDMDTGDCSGIVFCSCRNDQLCSITSLAWFSYGNKFVWGCSDGLFCVFDLKSKQKIIKADGSATRRLSLLKKITNIKISPSENFVATLDWDGFVVVRNTSNFGIVYTLKSNTRGKDLTWHPWQTGIIATGSGDGTGEIKVWDIRKNTHLLKNFVKEANAYITALDFNKRSGELAYCHYDESVISNTHSLIFPGVSKVVVLDGSLTVADCSPLIHGLIMSVSWSPDAFNLFACNYDGAVSNFSFLMNKKNSYNNLYFKNLASKPKVNSALKIYNIR